jgi:GT2 family glycosyltransferase
MSAGPEPTVFVLLPVHNRREITRRFIACLVEQTHPRSQLIVIDDGSTDGTARMVKQAVPDAVIIEGDGNWWWSGSMQKGYEWLLGQEPKVDDMVLLANDDIEFGPDFLERAVACLGAKPGALLGARLTSRDGGEALETGVHADMHRFTFRTVKPTEEIDCLPTRALLLRWSDMRRLGGFHPRLLPQYWADYEYTLRARRRGLSCFTSAHVAIRANMATTGEHDLDALKGWKLLRGLFSVKTPLNPVYRTWFVLLASSWAWKPLNVINVWCRAGFRMIWQGLLNQQFPRKTPARASV